MWISYGILDDKKLIDKNLNILYYVQLGVNALWSIFFFILKWRLFSFFWILLLDVLVIWMVIRMYKKDKTAWLLQIPYILWILFATYLTIAFYLLNN
jgi:tryptophan-rich sensory protein